MMNETTSFIDKDLFYVLPVLLTGVSHLNLAGLFLSECVKENRDLTSSKYTMQARTLSSAKDNCNDLVTFYNAMPGLFNYLHVWTRRQWQ